MAPDQARPLGDPVEPTGPALRPSQNTRLSGRYVTLIGLATEHIEPFYTHLSGDENAHVWDYMSDGPFPDASGLHKMLQAAIESEDVVAYAIVPTDRPATPAGRDNVVGVTSYVTIDPGNRTVETGLLYSPTLQRTTAATEAMYLMARHAFEDLGYRRYEWVCNALNAASLRAALRFGFALEGVHRKHMIVKGRNRDTARLAMIDDDWPDVQSALREWLDPSNFDDAGSQRHRLEHFRKK